MNTLIFTHASPQFLPSVILDADETVCGPNYTNLRTNNRYCYLNTPAGVFDGNIVLKRLSQQMPDLILVHADATLGCLPVNLPASVPKVLLIGDTHHLQGPIQNFLQYASQMDFDAIILWNRQHAHFFTEYGFQNVFWMPGLTFCIPEFPMSQERVNRLCFFGQIGPYHPRRNRIIQELQKLKIPIVGGRLTRRDSFDLVGSSTLSLNITLNSEFNLRVFETTQYGALLLTDKLSTQSGLEVFYENGEAIVTYQDTKDLCEKIFHFSQNSDLAEAIARKGQSVTREYFSLEARRKALFALLNNEVTFDVYRLAGEPRCLLPPCKPENRDSFQVRVQLYEYLQELHRTEEQINTVMTEGINPLIASDLADLVRLRQTFAIEESTYDADWKPAFQELGVQNLRTIAPSHLAATSSDMLVTSVADLDKTELYQTIQSKQHSRVFISDLLFNQDKRIDRTMVELGYETQHKTLYGLFAL